MAIDFKKFIKGIVLGNDVDPSKKLQVEVTSSATTATKTTVQASQTANRTIILPDASDTLVGKATTDTFTNKTFDADGTGNSITNIENADIKSGAAIDAAKLADGSVSNAEFQYLANVTSDIQTQFTNTNTAITDHVNDTTDAHDASAISNVPTGNLAATDVQNALNELQTDVDTRLLKAGDTMSGNLNMGSNLITSLGTPVSGTDAANKNYVDGVSAGLDPKESVRVATTASVGGSYATTPSNGRFTGAATTIDGVTLSVNDRVLIKDQVDQKQNGIYTYTASGEFTRSNDMDGSPASEVSGGNFVFVAEGATNSASGYVLIANGVVTLNTDNLVFTQFSGGANSANKTLSNLDSPTAINQSLLPGTDNTINLGSAAKRYTTGYMQEQRDASNNLVQSITSRTLYDSSGSASIDHSSTTVIAINSKRISSLGDAVDINDAVSKTDLMNALKNYITLGDAVSTVVGASVDTYGSGTTRPAGSLTGVTTGVTFTRSTSSPLTGTGSFILDKDAANRQGRVAYYAFTLQNADKAKVMQIEMDYIVNSGTFVAGSSSTDSDVIMYIHDVTNNVFIEPSSFKLLSNSSTIADKFIANFQTSATGTSYRLLFYISSTSSAAYSLKVDNITVKPCSYVYGTYGDGFVPYTPTFTGFGTVSSVQVYSRREGDSLRIVGSFTSGTSTATQARITLGYNGANANVSTASTIASNNILGTGNLSIASAHTVTYLASTGNNYLTLGLVLNNAGQVFTPQNGSTIAASGNVLSIDALVPIAGWATSTQVSDSYDGRDISFKGGNADGTTFAASFTNIPFNTVSYDTTNSYNSGNGLWTCPKAGKYRIYAQLHLSAGYTTSQGNTMQIWKNGASVEEMVKFGNGATITHVFQINTTLDLKAGDTIGIYSASSISVSLTASTSVNYLAIDLIQAPTTISATEVVAARYSTAAGQTISTSSVTIVDYDTKDYDTHNAVTTGASWKFTAPVQGFYSVKAHMMYSDAAWAVDDKLSMEIYKNGSQHQNLRYYEVTAATTAFSDLVGSGDIYLNAGDFIDIRVFQNSGSSKTIITQAIYNHISIHRIK